MQEFCSKEEEEEKKKTPLDHQQHIINYFLYFYF